MEAPPGLREALGVTPSYVGKNIDDYIVEVESEAVIRELDPDFARLKSLPVRGVIVTSRADSPQFDFVSRFFAPRVGVPEDPVTGSAHCVLIPYWADVLGKKELHALQLSKRGGELFCVDAGERVKISGRAVLYLEGTINV